MANIIIPGRSTRSPRWPMHLHGGHPLADGLILFVPLVQPGAFLNLVSMRPPDLASATLPSTRQALARRIGPNGTDRIGTAFTSGQYLGYTSYVGPILGAKTYGFSLAAGYLTVGAGQSTSVTSFLVSLGASSGTNYTRHSIVKNNDPALGANSASGDASSSTAIATTTLSTASTMRGVGTFVSATERHIHFGNVNKVTNTTSRAVTATFGAVYIGGAWRATTTVAAVFEEALEYAAVWNRVLTDAEAFEFNNNPWQLVRQYRRRFYIVTGTGGGTAVLAGTAAQSFANSASLKASAFLTGTAAQAFSNSANLSAGASIAGTVTVAFANSAALFGRASLSGAAAQAFANSASLFGRAALSGTAAQAFTLTADLTAFSGAQIAGTAAQAFTNSASLKVRAFLGGSASAAFTLSGSMSVGAAPIAGTATLAFINGATLRSVAPLAGTSALAFTGSAALEATAHLAGTAAQQFTVSADLSGAPAAVVETAPTGAGRSKRRRRRYFIEVDGQPIFVEGEAEAQALLDELAAESERKVERAEKRAIVRARVTGKAPKITRPRSVPKVELPRELAKAIGNPFEERVRAAMRDAEIRAYLEWQAEMDDEEALLALVA